MNGRALALAAALCTISLTVSADTTVPPATVKAPAWLQTCRARLQLARDEAARRWPVFAHATVDAEPKGAATSLAVELVVGDGALYRASIAVDERGQLGTTGPGDGWYREHYGDVRAWRSALLMRRVPGRFASILTVGGQPDDERVFSAVFRPALDECLATRATR